MRIEVNGRILILEKVQDSDWIYRGSLFLLQFFVGTNGRTTGGANVVLAVSLQSANPAQWSNANMRGKHHQKLAIFRYMVEVSGESTLSGEGQASKSTERECFSPPF